MVAIGGFMLLVLYVLLLKKEGKITKEYLRPLRNHTIGPTFLNCAIHRCHFHLTKNMRRILSDKGLL
ncbi:hypothetical protein MXB_1515 [Myxobolus squamalis]|nr:hypothetical protein MXB_1515 [Myxobolus squamalis]